MHLYSWKETVFHIAISIPLCFRIQHALNIWGNCLCWHRGDESCAKCVSCMQSTSLLSETAVFHMDERLAGWFRPFAFRESIIKDMVVCVGVSVGAA